MKNEIIDLLNDLRDNVQSMREEGESDLRSVLGAIDSVIKKTAEIIERQSNP